MKQPNLKDLVIDKKGTQKMREAAAQSKKVKITINIDADSLDELKKMANRSGASYQKLLNQLLKNGLDTQHSDHSRLEKLEKEVASLKKKIAA